MNRATAMNDAMRPGGRAMTVGGVGPEDAPCPVCGADVFGCECGPTAILFTSDDVAQAVAVAEGKARRSRELNEGFRQAVADLKAEVAALRAMDRVVAEVAREAGVRPARLVKYLGDLVDPPRIAYAEALAAFLCGEPDAVEPAPVVAEWFGRVDARVRRHAAA